MNDESTPEYICAVAVKSGSTAYQNGVIGETFIMDRCTSDSLQILRCHPDDGSDEGLVTLDDDGVTYTVLTITGDWS